MFCLAFYTDLHLLGDGQLLDAALAEEAAAGISVASSSSFGIRWRRRRFWTRWHPHRRSCGADLVAAG